MTNNKQVGLSLEPIVLASGSPRRSEILNSVGWDFEKRVPDVDESVVEGESAAEYVRRLAVRKASTIASELSGRIVLGADTTVVVDEEIIGKPSDSDEAHAMISRLSGRRHEVMTGVALVRNQRVLSDVVITSVNFSEMVSEEVSFLVDYGEPYDKAGGYAVQAQAALFIKGIDGDYWNVVGLPISRVYELYQQLKNGA